MQIDKGLKRNGQPRKIVARPQEANPAWRAAVANSRIGQPGDRRPQCKAMRSGTPGQCQTFAVYGSPYCYRHGGWRHAPKAKLEDNRKRKGYRYAQWALNAAQRARAEAHKTLNPHNAKEALGASHSSGSNL